MSDRVEFECNGRPVSVDVAPGETLLTVLRERLGAIEVKDGCAPQGQCGCCTVLVDGDARVACVTPAMRVAGRSVTTVDGLDAAVRERMAAALVETGGSQCGFCTPGIVVRAAALAAKGRTSRADLDRGLAAHLCRCTGWQTIHEALLTPTAAPDSDPTAASRHEFGRYPDEFVPRTGGARDLDAAARRAELEGGAHQRVGEEVPLGRGGFADDTAPRDALVAVPRPPGSDAESVPAAGLEWVVGESLADARAHAGKVQGRRTSVQDAAPLPLPPAPDGGVRLATGWVEPAYLEPDASWCVPGGEPASPLANGGAFGGKVQSAAPAAAQELADRLGRTVRVVYAREDTVRLGPKRPPVALAAVVRGDTLRVEGTVAGEVRDGDLVLPYRGVTVALDVTSAAIPGPPTARDLRAAVEAELRIAAEGALDAAGFDRASGVAPGPAAAVLLDNAVTLPDRGYAGARVEIDAATGAIEGVHVKVAAGDPLDETVLRAYVIGAAHMALGWVLTEGIAVDPETGAVEDLTIRSFGILRPKATPPIEVTIVDDPGRPRPRASDAAFVAVAAAAWNALARVDGSRPERFPARETRTARMLRR